MYIRMPITLVLHNARYQKYAVVTEFALKLHIELLFLPAYSPSLNLIERLWKFVKKQVLYGKYYPDLGSVCCRSRSFRERRSLSLVRKDKVQQTSRCFLH